MIDGAATEIDTNSTDPWTTRKLLQWMHSYFRGRNVDQPRLVAELLLAHVLQCERIRLYMEVDRPASPRERDLLRKLVTRAAHHEPVQYLLGEAWFFGMPFTVDRSTLIPRPSTETLVEDVLQWCRSHRPHGAHWEILDIGTGTGCIAISLARHLPQARIIASDIVPEALSLAQTNAERYGVADRIEFLHGSLFSPLKAQGESMPRFDVVCSNPPYIPDHEWDDLETNVKEYEPASALRGGAEGLDVVRPLIEEAGTWIFPGGRLAVEIAHCQRDAVLQMVQQSPFWVNEHVMKDHENFWRVLTVERNPEPHQD